MKSPEGHSSEKYNERPLDKALNLIFGEMPENLPEWQKAQRVLEVLGDPNWLPDNLSKECLYAIVHGVDYPDVETTQRLVGLAESKARDIFPELAGIDEVHMDQIEVAYNRWKYGQD